MTWNCQGAASKEFGKALKELIRLNRTTTVALIKPKFSSAHADVICKGINFSNWVLVEAIRFSGGIWIFWRDSILIDIVHTHLQSVVYGSPDCGLRRKIWEALDLTSFGTEGPWLSTGDYNSVMSTDEVSLPTHWNCHRSASFNDWVFDQGLVDMGFSGSKFTWTRGRYDHTFKGARLD